MRLIGAAFSGVELVFDRNAGSMSASERFREDRVVWSLCVGDIVEVVRQLGYPVFTDMHMKYVEFKLTRPEWNRVWRQAIRDMIILVRQR